MQKWTNHNHDPLADSSIVTVLIIDASHLNQDEDTNAVLESHPSHPVKHNLNSPNDTSSREKPRREESSPVLPFASNNTYWVRGSSVDYDAWAALGNPGWSWNDLVSYFQKVGSQLVFLSLSISLADFRRLKGIPVALMPASTTTAILKEAPNSMAETAMFPSVIQTLFLNSLVSSAILQITHKLKTSPRDVP
ncbi:gmc oxidoreductase [Phlyctema vagabunda]|uniref:Gmc oxidoreductase n=1 Tax=Phlyctema vagabunda TaxID=108571 RepID=A0ABR4P921_9HELO